MYISVDFHGSNLSKICATLEHKRINYMILNQKTGYEVEEIIDNKGKNKYQEIFKKAHEYVRLKMRVENINSKLMTNLQNPEIKKKILKIEEIISD